MLHAAHLTHEVGQRRPRGPGVVKHVSGVQNEVDVLAENVSDGRLEAALEVDSSLITAAFRIDLAVGGVTEVGIGDMSEAKWSGHTRDRCLAISSCAFRHGSAR